VPLRGGWWSADNTILYSDTRGIMRISANGETPESLVKTESKMLLDPQMLPDGKS
jgi:hypothetical protein